MLNKQIGLEFQVPAFCSCPKHVLSFTYDVLRMTKRDSPKPISPLDTHHLFGNVTCTLLFCLVFEGEGGSWFASWLTLGISLMSYRFKMNPDTVQSKAPPKHQQAYWSPPPHVISPHVRFVWTKTFTYCVNMLFTKPHISF